MPRVDTRDLCGIKGIALRYGLSSQAVSNRASRHREFPKPLARIGDGYTPVYSMDAIDLYMAIKSRD